MLSMAILMLLISRSKEADGGNDNSAASGQPEEFERILKERKEKYGI